MSKQVAAGNKNWDARNTSPACALLVNTVGATNISDEKTRGSNYGVYHVLFRRKLLKKD